MKTPNVGRLLEVADRLQLLYLTLVCIQGPTPGGSLLFHLQFISTPPQFSQARTLTDPADPYRPVTFYPQDPAWEDPMPICVATVWTGFSGFFPPTPIGIDPT